MIIFFRTKMFTKATRLKWVNLKIALLSNRSQKNYCKPKFHIYFVIKRLQFYSAKQHILCSAFVRRKACILKYCNEN